MLFKKIPKSPKEIFIAATNAKHHNVINNVVVQTYITSPLLINGMKFDLRVYVLVLSVNPLKVYIYKDGLARFATEKYSNPSQSNVKNVKMHLTNYAINRKSKNFDREIGEGKGSKRYIADVFKEIASIKKYNITVDELWGKISDIVIKTLLTIQPMLSQSCSTCHNGLKVPTSPCFEILGFDILLDSKLKAWILEVNHSPSFTCDTILDFEIKRGVIINALRMIDFDNLIRSKLNKKIKQSNKDRSQLTSNASSVINNSSHNSNELPKIENKENVTHSLKKKDEKKERKNSYSGQYSISTLMDKNKMLAKDLQGIVLYSKMKGPHNLNSYSINNQNKMKKDTKEVKTKKRVIDNHVSNSIASEVYLGKPLAKIRKNKKVNNAANTNTTKKTDKNKNNEIKKENNKNKNENIKNTNKNDETNEINKENDSTINEKINEDDEDRNNNLDNKNRESVNEDENLDNENIFENHDFMSILKLKKEYTVEEVLKLQNIYEDENKGNYYKAYPCNDEERMKKYRCFTQLTSKSLNTNTITTKIRLEYLRKKREKEEEEERKRILWKKKVKQGYFIGRYKINKKDEVNIYERLYNKFNNTNRKTIKSSSSSSSSTTSYTSIANIKNLSLELDDYDNERLDSGASSVISLKRNNSTVLTLPNTLNRNLVENPTENSNKLFKINYPYNIKEKSSFNNFNDKKKNNIPIKNNLLFINGKQINNNDDDDDDDDNSYFKYVLMNEKISKEQDSIRCQSAPALRKQQSLSNFKAFDIVFENYN